MALKFVALLLFVCAAQVQTFARLQVQGLGLPTLGFQDDARKCVEEVEPDVINLAQTAEEILIFSVQDLTEEVETKLGPLAEDMEAKTQEAMQTVQKTLKEIEALISEGKLLAARDRLNEGRQELDSQVTAIAKEVQETGQKFPELAEDAENMEYYVYENTFSRAQTLLQKVQNCIDFGKN